MAVKVKFSQQLEHS